MKLIHVLLGTIVVFCALFLAMWGIAGHNPDKSVPKSTVFRPYTVSGQGKTEMQLRGSGTGRTELFEPASDWNLYFDFSCPEASKSSGFSIDVMLPSQIVYSQAVSLRGQVSGYGNKLYTGGGMQYYAQITAPQSCHWSVIARSMR